MGLIAPSLSPFASTKAASPTPPSPAPSSETSGATPEWQKSVDSLRKAGRLGASPLYAKMTLQLYFGKRFTSLSSSDQDGLVSALLSDSGAAALSSRGGEIGSGDIEVIGGSAGAMAGEAALALLAPESGGLSLTLAPLIGAVGGGTVGNAAYRVATHQPLSAKSEASAGLRQGLYEMGGRAISSGLRKVLTPKALSAADRAVAATADKFGIKAGPREISRRFEVFNRYFDSPARVQAVRDASVKAAQDQLASLGPLQEDIATTRAQQQRAISTAKGAFNAVDDRNFLLSNRLNHAVQVPLDETVGEVDLLRSGAPHGGAASLLETLESRFGQKIGNQIYRGLNQSVAEQIAPEAKAVSDVIAQTEPLAAVYGQPLPSVAAAQKALASGNMDAMEKAATSLVQESAPLTRATSLRMPNGKPAPPQVLDHLAPVREAAQKFLDDLNAAREHPILSWDTAEATRKAANADRTHVGSPDESEQSKLLGRLGQALKTDQFKAIEGNPAGSAAFRRALDFHTSNIDPFSSRLGRILLDPKRTPADIGAVLMNKSVTGEQILDLKKALSNLRGKGAYGEIIANEAERNLRVASMQALLADPQGGEVFSRSLALLPTKVKSVSPSKIAAIFGSSGPERAAFDNIVAIGRIAQRAQSERNADMMHRLFFAFSFGLGSAGTALFSSKKQSSGSYMTRYATGMLGLMGIGGAMARIANSQVATRWLLRSAEDAAASATATDIVASSRLMDSAIANASRAFALAVHDLNQNPPPIQVFAQPIGQPPQGPSQ